MKKNRLFKRVFSLLLCLALLLCAACPALAEEDGYEFDTTGVDYQKFRGQNVSINVYNWGLYIAEGEDESMNVCKEFEKLTGIKVNYTNFATNEEMYAKLKSGASKYDVIFPSDYMVGKLIEEGMLAELNFKNIPNYERYVDDNFKNLEYDPEGKYSVAYTWGTVGILYNTAMVEKEVNSWDILWDMDYAGQILMFNNSRDAFGIALKKLGYSMNTTDKDQLKEAADLLKEQKPLVQAYVMDEIFDKLGAGEAAIAPYYAGDYALIKADNPDIAFAFPEEGTNRFVDAACVPKDCNNQEAAELFINFLNDPAVAYENFETIGYSSPNTGALELMGEEEKADPVLYPGDKVLESAETFLNLDDETNEYMQQLWIEVLSDDQNVNRWIIPVFVAGAVAVSLFINVRRSIKNRRKRYEK